jgi:thioredoxin-related protein
MSKIYQRIELTANLLIIVVAILIVGVLAHRYLSPAPKSPQPKGPTVGSKLSLTNLDLSKSNKNVLLVLQKGCHFCSESAEFYKRLIAETKGSNVNIVAVLPQEKQEAEGYLDSLGIKGVEIRQSRLDSLSVSGTPTIIVLNDKGDILAVWVGKLPAEKEKEVLAKLSAQT